MKTVALVVLVLVVVLAVIALALAIHGVVIVDIEGESASIDRGVPPRAGYEECQSIGCELCCP